MKKVLVLLVTFVLSITLQAQNKVSVVPKAAFDMYLKNFSGRLSREYIDKTTWTNFRRPYYVEYSYDCRFRLGTDIKWRRFVLTGEIYTYMDATDKGNGFRISPKLAEYRLGLTYSITKEVRVMYQQMRAYTISSSADINPKVSSRYGMLSLLYNY